MSTRPLPDASAPTGDSAAADGVRIQRIREQFPAINSTQTALLDNAGGSQAPRAVADAIRDYMLNTYVQLGADYDVSVQSTQTVQRAHDFVRLLMNGDGIGEVALGASSSSLLRTLGDCYADALPAGSRIIVAEWGHESNIGPWVRHDGKAFEVVWWRVSRETGMPRLEELRELVKVGAAVVAFPHASNLFGDLFDVAAATKIAHGAGARVVVDGVAFAPHRAIDVRALDVDWYVYSTYKVYGPHMGAMFGKKEAFAEITGPNHFFIPREAASYKFELGGVSHEGCAGLLGLWRHLCFLAGEDAAGPWRRQTIELAFERMQEIEAPLQARLIEYLSSRNDVRIIGPASADPAERVSTISFVHKAKPSREIAQGANRAGHGIRFGHFYAWRLCEALGLQPEDGVVRVSLVHYNTMDEVERLIGFLDSAL